MTIKRRIWIIYIVSVLIPFFLFTSSMEFFSKKINKNINEEITRIEQSYWKSATEDIINFIENNIKPDPSVLKDEKFITIFDDSIKLTQFSVEIFKEGESIFSSNTERFEKSEDNQLIESGEFTGSDNLKYDYEIITRQRKPKPRQDPLNSIFKINGTLFLLGYIILHFIFFRYSMKTVFSPLNKMKEAAINIRDGNLDYNLDYNRKDEVGDVFDAFEEMRVQLKTSRDKQNQYERNRKELIANISHDLKTPITAINGYVQGILDGVANTDEKLNKYIKTISSYSKDMDNLIEDLFLFSKLDIDSFPFDFENVNIIEYINDCIEEINFDLEKNNIKLNKFFSYNSETPVFIDRAQIKRVINNIIFNSINNFDNDNPIIFFRIVEDDDYFTISISDNGPGIPMDKINHIFDRFYRVDNSRNRKNGGSGLGLSIAKQIIESHKGKIWAESSLGNGTTIFFSLKKVEVIS